MHWTEITERTAGDVVIVDVRGQMTLSEPDSSLFHYVSTLIAGGRRLVVLNLQHVSYIDSVGIGEIVRSFIHLGQCGGMLRLCAVSPRTREVLEATHLDTILQPVESEDEAVRIISKEKAT